ncbi:hypothetical protein [Rhodococcus zopfii]|uniref:hypothetical protein n=1 Tax=Rhodococcus zopfii TaxID=43772 RepID=UPI0009340B52|nr:hypothetical protein [Rhodococcus zopfii]
MPEYVRPSQMGTPPPQPQHGTEEFRRHRRIAMRARRLPLHPAGHPIDRDRDAQLATLEHLAERGFSGQGMDVDVVREFWREHPEHRDLAVHCAPPRA